MSAHYLKKESKKKTEENDAKHPSQTDSTLEEAHVFFLDDVPPPAPAPACTRQHTGTL